MSDGHSIKIDRRAFNRGVEDLITLRPLRDVVGSVLGVRTRTSAGKVVVEQKAAAAEGRDVKSGSFKSSRPK